jgi:hypothetical protein
VVPESAVRGLGVVVALAVLAAIGPGGARAADECNGLPVCLPVEGPWVVVPGRGAAATSSVVWELKCPLVSYVVAGIDARVTDRAVDVSFRGESGSPVSPGVTTGRSVLFTAVFAGTSTSPTSFRPSVGCVPTQGGGGRSQTSVQRSGAVKPGKPIERRVVTARLRSGDERRIVARCPPGTRLVGADHAAGIRLPTDPSDAQLRLATTSRTTIGNAVVTRASVGDSATRALRIEVQVHALCAKVTR